MKCVLVVGMHRSGTSAMSGLLKICGAYQGRSASVNVYEENPKGHFENEALRIVNDYMLTKLDCSWNRLSKEIVCLDMPKEFSAVVKILMKNEFSGEEFISLKDPRMSLFLDVYLQALSENYDVSVIRMMRPKEEVIKSLNKRGNEYDYDLYEKYNNRLDYLIEKHKPNYIEINFEDLIKANPLNFMKNIKDKLDLPFKEIYKGMIVEFINPELKHF